MVKFNLISSAILALLLCVSGLGVSQASAQIIVIWHKSEADSRGPGRPAYPSRATIRPIRLPPGIYPPAATATFRPKLVTIVPKDSVGFRNVYGRAPHEGELGGHPIP